ncbi:kinase-like domain-containing protein [Aspergillus coremiiformis]|uniref:Kinase-like domain-containing protein n=1 Tax=Aspergillus coremiiformis TaxID=138285 RepID=A0A5N6Z6Y0_9EURO|nr:kinase-like domain-containing protein [Aspergillus coremiiformis]
MDRVSKPSRAARLNERILKRMQAAIASDPEVDFTTKLPKKYSTRLANMRNSVDNNDPIAPARPNEEDIRDSLDASAPVETIYPLSKLVLDLLEDVSRASGSLSASFSERLIGMMQASEIIWKGPDPDHKMVFKCNASIVLKAVRGMEDFTEYTALQYLRQHRPDLPIPSPLGLLRLNGTVLIFMSYQPGKTLTDVWPTLDQAQKASIQAQLNKILNDLRSLPFTPGAPLGGIGGEGCKDVRRHLRRSDKPITRIDEFEQFLFTGRRPGGYAFVEFMRELCPPPSSCSIVFTHGDLRPDNITVEMAEDHGYIVTGLIDWEYSGFYPEYYEAVKTTNCLWPYDEDDWYLFLPDCVSPKRYAHWWLLDRVRETRVV